MLTLKVEVPEARDRGAFATLRDGMRTIATGPAVASATRAYAEQHANPECDPLRLCGHPPLGRYRLMHHEATGAGQPPHYGAHLLLFEPLSGPALDAETFGRLGLLVFGGPPARRTQGGLRLGNELMNAIVPLLSRSADMTLDLVPLRERAWWQFWKTPQPPSQPLSGDPLNPPQPLHDELALLEALLQKAVRRPRRTATDRDDRDDRFDRDTRRDSSTSSSGDSFQGKGGESGGAGASGRWDEGAGKGSGVDSAGRIVAGAAAVGAVAAAAAAMAHGDTGAPGAESSGSGSGADTTTGTSY